MSLTANGPTAPPAATPLGIPFDLPCQECGYNLRGLTGRRCPECGCDLDDMLSDISRIPWAHRDKLGRFQAYWRTVFWVSFRYRRFCGEVVRPVDYADAQRFRWLTILHAFIPLVVVVGIASAEGALDWSLVWAEDRNCPTWWPYVAAVLMNTLVGWWLVAATGLTSYFFESRHLPAETRNRAIALSYYCAGGLAWFAPLMALAIAGSGLLMANVTAGAWLVIFALTMTLVALADWYINLLRTLRHVLPDRLLRRAAATVMLPVGWVAVGVLLPLVAIPLAYAVLLVLIVLS